ELLHIPVQRIRHVDILFLVERQEMRFAVAVRSLALRAARPQYLSFQVELHDEAGMTERHHDVLVVVTHAEPAGRARMARFMEEFAVAVESLYALVRPIGDVNVALAIGDYRVRHVELPRPLAFPAPAAQEISVRVELEHARFSLAVPLRDVDLAVR